MIGGSPAQFLQAMLLGPWLSMTGRNKMVTFIKKPNPFGLVSMKDMLEDGKVVPVIDRRYMLSEVPEAIRYLEEGNAKGKVVVTLQ